MTISSTLFGDLRARGVVVDLFCGGGGASEGIRRATGACPDVAINHNEHAIAMHAANHPRTIHAQEDVWAVVPRWEARGRAVDILWASPQCTHFSRARGGVPCSDQQRSQAWVVVEWARAVRPRCIIVENVPEWLTWGPLDEAGQPDPARRGETFRAWVQALEDLGYAVDWRVLKACDYGAPTSRTRIYLVARCDGDAPSWPEPSHGPGRALPWRTAADCIDWDLPCPSIFLSPQEARAAGCRRPLAEATLRRIAEGVRRYVLDCPRPFLLGHTHGGRLRPLDRPFPTITTSNRGEVALVAPFLTATWNGETKGQRPRTHDPQAPMPTVTAQGSQGAVVAAFLDKLHGSARAGQPVDAPAPTISAGGGRGGGHAALVVAFLAHYYSGGGQGQGLADPVHTVTTHDRHALVTVQIDGEPYVITDIGMRMLSPRELARAQGFPDSYILTGTRAQQIERIGNSVCPDVAEVLVRAQLVAERRAARAFEALASGTRGPE